MPSSDSVKSYQTIPSTTAEATNNGTATMTIKALGAIRAVAGVGLLIAPVFIGKLFFVPVTAQSSLLARGVGVRDLVLGELLLTADQKVQDKKEVKRALLAGMATDVLDLGATAVAFSTGQLARTGAGLFGGAASAFLLMGLYGLRSLN